MIQTAAATTEYRHETDSRAQLQEFAEFHFPADPEYPANVSIEIIPAGKRTPRQLFYCSAAELPAKLAGLRVLEYLNYYVTANFIKGKNRGNENIFRLINIVMDLDCHAENVTQARREWLINSFVQFLKNKGLPLMCNTIVETGRGLQLWWALEPVSYKMQHAYNVMRSFLREDVEKILQEWREFYRIEPEEFGFDKNASSNAAGFFRLPDTFNTKTDPLKKATPQRIHSNRLDITAEIGRRVALLINERRSSEGKGWDNILKFPTSAAYLGAARAAMLFNLQAMRAAAGRPITKGMRDWFLLCLYCVLASVNVSHEAAMQRVNTANARFPDPMTQDEIKSSLSSAVTKRYRLTNQYIIDALQITPEEQNALRFYKGGAMLNNTREQLAEAARKKKAGRDAAILEHYNKGETLQQIAEAVGCTAPTVRNVLQRAGLPSRSETLRGRIRILYQQGNTPAEIAEATGAHLATIYRHIKKAREAGEIWATDGAKAPAGEFIEARAKEATEAKTALQDPQPMKRAAREAGQDPDSCRRSAASGAEIWPQSVGNNRGRVFIHQHKKTATAAAEPGNITSGINAEGGAVPGIVAPVFAKIKKTPPIGLVTVTDKQYSNDIVTADPEEIRDNLREKIERRRPILTAEETAQRQKLIEQMRRNREKWAAQGIDPLPLPWPARRDPDRLRE